MCGLYQVLFQGYSAPSQSTEARTNQQERDVKRVLDIVCTAAICIRTRSCTPAHRMAANPPLTRTFDNSLAPTPYQGESIVLRRDCIDLKLSCAPPAESASNALRAARLLSQEQQVFPDSRASTATFALTAIWLCRWSARGSLYLTNMRLVFIANQPDAASGAP